MPRAYASQPVTRLCLRPMGAVAPRPWALSHVPRYMCNGCIILRSVQGLSSLLQARVDDGLAAVASLARERPGALDYLIVDAGADDASLAMSCPPAPFLEPGFLGAAAAALCRDGLLAVNCVARADAPVQAAVRVLQVRMLTFSAL